jgi:hypothetical protein
MSVFIDSKQAVLNYVNAANSTTRFTTTNVVMGKPKDTALSDKHSAKTMKNTYLVCQPGPDKIFKGRKFLYYNRLRLEDFARFRSTRKIRSPQPATTHDLIPAIRYYLAIWLSEQDIENDPVTIDEFGQGTATIRAKADSPLWLGELTVEIEPGGNPLDQWLTNISPDQLKYPIDNFKDGSSAAVITYPIDATYYRDDLLLIEEGELHGTELDKLVEVLKALDYSSDGKTLWNSDQVSTEWSLSGASVFYNGLNEAALPTNPAFKYVIGIELRSDVTIPSGRFYIHYTDPENTDELDTGL